MSHIPVLLQEVLATFAGLTLRTVFDGTCGAGGHAQALLIAHPEIERYCACDQDQEALDRARLTLSSFGEKVTFCHTNFSMPPQEPPFFDAVLLDIGVSSMQLDTPARGFSFMKEGPLDMRMDSSADLTAEEIVNHWDRLSLERIFTEYGEEPKARKAADAIVEARKRRPMSTTLELAEVLSTVLLRRGKCHPATQVFQALRIAVNGELDVLRSAIPLLANRLSVGGRMAIITFHSLEDRIVKQGFKELAQSDQFSLVYKKPLAPQWAEVKKNSRARSAKLRAIVRNDFQS